MATLYMVNLEERAEIARHQLELVILRLRSVGGQSRPEGIHGALNRRRISPCARKGGGTRRGRHDQERSQDRDEALRE